MDDTKMSQWLTGYKSGKLISGDDNAVGSKYELIF